MLKKLQEQDFDRYVDFAYQLALDMTKHMIFFNESESQAAFYLSWCPGVAPQ